MLFHHSITRLTSFAIIFLALAAPARGQQKDTAAARTDSARARAFLLPPLVVSASRTPVRPDRVGFALSAVTARDLTERNPVYTFDALREVTGAFVDEAAGPGGPTIVRLRGGEEVFTQILIDGIAINENGGFFDFQGLALSNLDRIEVLRGPQSALFGSSAVSGVVHFITPRGQPGSPRISMLAEGSGATEDARGYRVTAAGSGGSEILQWSGGAGTAFARGIYPLPNDTRTTDGSVRLDAALSSRFELSGLTRWIGMDSKLPVRDAGATRAPLDPNARNERDRMVSSVKARLRSPSGNWSHQLETAHYYENFVYDDRFDDVGASGDFDFFIFDATFSLDSRRDRTTVQYAGNFAKTGNATFSWGTQWEREAVRNLVNFEGNLDRQSMDRNSVAGFAELLFSPANGMDLLAGARVEKYQGLDAEWTPRISAVFDLVHGRLSARAAAGRAYKAPNLQQQYFANPFIASNPDIAPETSVSWELGLEARNASGRIAADAAYFRQRFDDLIRTVALNDSMQINRNVGRSRAHGIEWTARAELTEHWTIGTQGAWTRTEVLDNAGLNTSEYPVNEELPFRPSVVASTWLQAAPSNRFGATLRGTVVGSQTVLTERFSGQRVRLDSYMLMGLNLHLDVSASVRVYGRVDNLLGTSYETAFDRTGIPRTAALGLRINN